MQLKATVPLPRLMELLAKFTELHPPAQCTLRYSVAEEPPPVAFQSIEAQNYPQDGYPVNYSLPFTDGDAGLLCYHEPAVVIGIRPQIVRWVALFKNQQLVAYARMPDGVQLEPDDPELLNAQLHIAIS